MTMDAIILAAGRGTRLRGVAAPYFKPFMVVNGSSLIVRTTRIACNAVDGQVFIIAAPDNVVPMITLLQDALDDEQFDRTRWLVQPEPRGPGQALLLGLDSTHVDTALVLMADNELDEKQVMNCVGLKYGSEDPDTVVIGGSVTSDADAASHFTRIGPDLVTREGLPVTEDERWPDDDFVTWVGPLVLPVTNARDVLNRPKLIDDELKIGPYLCDMGSIDVVLGHTIDIGTTEQFGGES